MGDKTYQKIKVNVSVKNCEKGKKKNYEACYEVWGEKEYIDRSMKAFEEIGHLLLLSRKYGIFAGNM